LIDKGFCGFNWVAENVIELRARLRLAIERGGLSGETIEWSRRDLQRVLHVFNELKYYDGEVIFVGLTAEDTYDPEATLRHERAHSAQRKLADGRDDIGHAGDPIAFLEHPLAARAAVALRELYPDDPDTLVSEIGAHLAEGPAIAPRLGLTVDEAAELAEFYVGALVERHGNIAYHLRALSSIRWDRS
jgi:hypothetical protein